MNYAILACGGRDFEDHALVEATLDRLSFDVLIHGGARGADQAAAACAKRMGIYTLVVPAPWHTHGPSAGPRRNYVLRDLLLSYSKHLDLEPAVLAFPGGRGTAHMVRVAKAAGITTWKALPDGQLTDDPPQALNWFNHFNLARFS